MSKHRSRKAYRKLTVEQMETRQLLAGNVQAFIDNDGDLVVRGDSADNQVRISVDTLSNYFVDGLNGTTINGYSQSLGFNSPSDSLRISMHAGNDLVLVEGLDGGEDINQLFASADDGDDVLQFSNFKIIGDQASTVKSGGGADVVQFDQDFRVTKKLQVYLGSGDNLLRADDVDINQAWFGGGSGDDATKLSDAKFTNLTVSLGDGENLLDIGRGGDDDNLVQVAQRLSIIQSGTGTTNVFANFATINRLFTSGDGITIRRSNNTTLTSLQSGNDDPTIVPPFPNTVEVVRRVTGPDLVTIEGGSYSKLTIIADDGNTNLLVRNLGVGTLVVDLGQGLNTLSLENVNLITSSIVGGDGQDIVFLNKVQQGLNANNFRVPSEKLNFNLGGGDDTLSIGDVFSSGFSEDRASLVAKLINVDLGDGNNTFGGFGIKGLEQLNILTGGGNDAIHLRAITGTEGLLGGVNIQTGAGNDDVRIASMYASTLVVLLGAGNDALTFERDNLSRRNFTDETPETRLDGGSGFDELKLSFQVAFDGLHVTGFEKIS